MSLADGVGAPIFDEWVAQCSLRMPCTLTYHFPATTRARGKKKNGGST